MKKTFIILLILICVTTLTTCSLPKINTSEAVNIYSDLSGFKGLELYVWIDNKTNQVYCGLMEGTNREKNEQDFKIILNNPVTVDKMKEILASYDKDMFVIIIGLDASLSSDTVAILKSYLDNLQMPNILYKTE